MDHIRTLCETYSDCATQIDSAQCPNMIRFLFLTTYIVLFSLFYLVHIFGYLKMSEILVIFFSLLIFLIKFIVNYIISFSYYRQTNFSDHTNSILFSLFKYIFRNIVGKNMQIIFKKLYGTHSGSAA